jgi:deoxyribose-phosphate aldolase
MSDIIPKDTEDITSSTTDAISKSITEDTMLEDTTSKATMVKDTTSKDTMVKDSTGSHTTTNMVNTTESITLSGTPNTENTLNSIGDTTGHGRNSATEKPSTI